MDFPHEQAGVLRDDLLRYNPIITKNSPSSYCFANKFNEENYNFSDEGKLNQLEINYCDDGKESEAKSHYSSTYTSDDFFNEGTNSFFDSGLDTEPRFLDYVAQFNPLPNFDDLSYDFQSTYEHFCEGYHLMDTEEKLKKKQPYYFSYSGILEQLCGEEEKLKQSKEEIKTNEPFIYDYPIDSFCLACDEFYDGKTLEEELRFVNSLDVFLDKYETKDKTKPQPKPTTQNDDIISFPPFDFLCPTNIAEWIFESQNSWNNVFPMIDSISKNICSQEINTKSIGTQTNSFSKSIGTETDFSSTSVDTQTDFSSTSVDTQTDFSSTSVDTQTDFQSMSVDTKTDDIETTRTIGTNTESEIKNVSTQSESVKNDPNLFNSISEVKPKNSITTTTTIATQTDTENLWAIIPYVSLSEILFPQKNDKEDEHIIPSMVPISYPKYEIKSKFLDRVFENSEFLCDNVSNVIVSIKNLPKKIKNVENSCDKDWVVVNNSKQDDEWELI